MTRGLLCAAFFCTRAVLCPDGALGPPSPLAGRRIRRSIANRAPGSALRPLSNFPDGPGNGFLGIPCVLPQESTFSFATGENGEGSGIHLPCPPGPRCRMNLDRFVVRIKIALLRPSHVQVVPPVGPGPAIFEKCRIKPRGQCDSARVLSIFLTRRPGGGWFTSRYRSVEASVKLSQTKRYLAPPTVGLGRRHLD